MDVVLVHDALLHFVEHVKDFLAGGLAVVHDEVRMLGGDLGIADSKSHEATVFDHGAYIVSRWAQVHGAGASLFERLLGAARNLVFRHFSLDFFRISFGEVDLHADDDVAIVHEDAIAVAVVEIIPAVGFLFLAVFGNRVDFFYHFFHLAAVAIGIHENSAANGAGDAYSPFEAFEAILFCKASDRAGAGAAGGSDPGVFAGHFRFHAGGAEGDAANAFVADQGIRAAADNGDRDPCFVSLAKDGSELLFGLRAYEYIRRSADAIGGVAAHGFIDFNVSLCEDSVEKCFPICHF